ncbi:hypothetical protein LR48_Vigan07g203700 [Vigna angularis]|uniref:Uncharacterized protein n=1 Tax=Phaseolus angularis TaxID=3914 RepID=A0A0L9UZX8_PHAAN|nr:hypothetical protein LR48_Vigan07g203700 [Vigna angularis]
MAQALGWVVHVDEVFAQTHVRKGSTEFVDERSPKTHEEFSTRLSQVRSEHRSAPTPEDVSIEDNEKKERYLKLHTFIPPSLRPSHDPPRHPPSLSNPHQSSHLQSSRMMKIILMMTV